MSARRLLVCAALLCAAVLIWLAGCGRHYAVARPLPAQVAAQRVAPFPTDTLYRDHTSYAQAGKIAQLVLRNVYVHDLLVATCVFAVLNDSTMIAYPGLHSACAHAYDDWVQHRGEPKR